MRKIVSALLVFVILLSFSACGLAGLMSNNKQNTTYTTPRTTKSSSSTSKPKPTTPKPTAAPTEPPSVDISGDSYEHNEYYDIVETALFKNSIGYSIIVHKVLAKKDASVASTMLAYDSEENVIGKSSDEIVLTKDKYNFFRYSFEADVANTTTAVSAKIESDSYLVGPRNAVEMEKYNLSGTDLYITLNQVSDKLGSFAKFKLLYYKNDQIIDTDEGYFSIYAENLTGKGSTDVASIWAYGIDFDRIEYIFEP